MKALLTLCTTCTTCPQHLRRLLEQLEQHYGGALEIELEPCLAACDAAPAVFINDTYYPRIDLARLLELIEAEQEASYGEQVRSLA